MRKFRTKYYTIKVFILNIHLSISYIIVFFDGIFTRILCV